MVIIDQFLASGERKWLQRTGLTLSLPHGVSDPTLFQCPGRFLNSPPIAFDFSLSSRDEKKYDGQGPEHSSGRIERFLQLCDDHPFQLPSPDKMQRQIQDCNMQIVVPSTPASIFHVLRRQVHRDFRKP